MTRPAPVPPAVKGWCPGALRPMESGDGLIVRLRISGGIVPPATLAAIGDLAARHGNGLIDLSQRANLQIRGVTPQSLGPLQADLDGLGLLDPDPAAEAVRNVIGPPLAGLDPTARLDGTALVRALEALLAGSADLHALPDKFGFLVDDGGRLSLDAIPADIRLTGTDAGVLVSAGGDGRTAVPVALVPEDGAVEAAAALARSFLKRRGAYGPAGEIRRMAGLIARAGEDTIRDDAGFAGPAPERAIRPATGATDLLAGRAGHLAVAAPFGRLDAAQIAALAACAPAGLRLTPFRTLLVPAALPGARDAFARAGLIVDDADPRLAVVACPGAPACPSAAVDTRVAAAALAPLLAGAPGVALHLSGCSKGCARPGPTALTLVGRDGRYDLVRDGRAGDAPVLRGLDLAAARREVETRTGPAGSER